MPTPPCSRPGVQAEIGVGDPLARQLGRRRPRATICPSSMQSTRSATRQRALQILLDQHDRGAGRDQRRERGVDARRPRAATGRATLRRAAARRGLVISARPIAVACCSPPESVPARGVRRGLQIGNVSSTVAEGPRPRAGRRRAPSSRFSSTVSCANSRRPSGTSARPSADAPVRRHARDVGAVEQHAPAARRMRAGDGAQQRGLAGAVGADQRHRLAGRHGEGDAAHRLQQAVPRRRAPRPSAGSFGRAAEIGVDHRRVGHHRARRRRRR